MSGYIRLFRSLMGHPAFGNDGEAMAFAWLIAKAQWRQTRVRYKGRAFDLERGQVAISQRDMARALGRDKAYVDRLWTKAKGEAMIETDVRQAATVITICNYDKYQQCSDAIEPANEAPMSQQNVDVEPVSNQQRTTEQIREESNQKNQGARDAREDIPLNGKKVTKPKAQFEFAGEETIMRGVRQDFDASLPAGEYAVLFCDPRREITFVSEEGRLVAYCADGFTHSLVRDHEFRLAKVAQQHGFSTAWVREYPKGESP